VLNTPNLITLVRILLIPVFLLLFWSDIPNGILYSMIIVGISGLTDMIDGYLARKYNMITPLGEVLDPLADKLMIITVMTSLYLIGKLPSWLVLLVLVKEVVLVVGGVFLMFKKRIIVSANFYGKAATALIYLALFFGAFGLDGKSATALFAGVASVIALANYIYGFTQRQEF